MMRRAMALVAGLTVLAAPALMAQEGQGDQAGMQQRMQEHMQQRGPGMQLGLDRKIGQLMDRRYELNLTDGQMEQLRVLRDEARSALAPLREQMKNIHEGMRDGSMERDAAHDAMQGLHEQLSGSMEGFHERLEGVLEPEQRAALRHGRAQRGRRGAMCGRGRMREQRERMQHRKQAEEEPASVDS